MRHGGERGRFLWGQLYRAAFREQAWYLAPVEALLKAQVIGKIRLSTRPDYIDEARLLFLRQHQVPWWSWVPSLWMTGAEAGRTGPYGGAGGTGRYSFCGREVAVAQAAFLYEQLTGAGIKVIRVGLQPDAELCQPGNILAGPFHPSMGELVQGYLRQQQVAAILRRQKYVPADQVLLRFPKRLESQMRGQHNVNVKLWRELVAPATLILERF
jgi:hypothetical protein